VTLAAAGITATASCTADAENNLLAPTADFAAPLGIPTERTLLVGFINNTPFRAIFTFGTYDQLNKDALPVGFVQIRLEGNTASAQIAQPCRKTFSLGGAELIQLIEVNAESPLINITDPEALVVGVNFSSAPANDPLAAEPTEGKAEPLVLLNGVAYTCLRTDIRETTGTGLIIVTFEQDASAPGGFVADFEFVEP
jgi:hypothetical protein